MHASGIRESDTQRFGLNFRYNFGIRKKEESNIFNVDSPERSN
jgi:iron complex outermembrane receptor protein